MPVLDVGVLRTWQYAASVVREHTWAAESAEKFGQFTDCCSSDISIATWKPRLERLRVMIIPRPAAPPVTTAIPDVIAQSTSPSARSSPTSRSDAWL